MTIKPKEIDLAGTRVYLDIWKGRIEVGFWQRLKFLFGGVMTLNYSHPFFVSKGKAVKQ